MLICPDDGGVQYIRPIGLILVGVLLGGAGFFGIDAFRSDDVSTQDQALGCEFANDLLDRTVELYRSGDIPPDAGGEVPPDAVLQVMERFASLRHDACS